MSERPKRKGQVSPRTPLPPHPGLILLTTERAPGPGTSSVNCGASPGGGGNAGPVKPEVMGKDSERVIFPKGTPV